MDEDGKKSKKTATYTYDLLGRITKETKTGSEDISYTYDSNNNRKKMTVGNKVTAYKYNKNDELLRTDTLNTDTEEDSVVIYKNDKNGNQLATVNRYEIPSDQKDKTYVDVDVTLGDNRLNENVVNHYNALNQLTKTLTKNYKVSFTYDAEGLRTSKTVNGEKTVFVWDGDQLVMELSESGKIQKRYIRGNDLVYADKGTDTEKQYYVMDPHGNVVQLTDESGTVTKTYEYDSFGNEVNPDKKDDNSFRYCGEYYDKETEEVYLRARYYQPAVGRFLTRDTYTGEEDDPLSLHLYTYCENDGVNAWDPSGNKKAKWGKWKFDVYPSKDKNRVKKGKRARAFHYIETKIRFSSKKKKQKLSKKTLVYMFEGMGTGNRLKAMTLIVKKNKVIAAFTRTSTIPDFYNIPSSSDMHYAARIKEGEYNISFEYGSPKAGFPQRYRVSRKNGNQNIPCQRKNYTLGYGKTANGVLIHAATDSKSQTRPWSIACMLIEKNLFKKFYETVGRGTSSLIVDRRIYKQKYWE